MDDPHGDLDRNEEAKAATMTIYGTKAKRSYKISTAWSENRGIFFVTTQYLQYVIMRNALNREVNIEFVLIFNRVLDCEKNQFREFPLECLL